MSNGYRSKYGRRKGKNVYIAKGTEQYIQDNLYAKLTPEEKDRMEIWSMDFTEQKIFTCGIISVKRKILVGYAQGRRCTTELAIEAVANALSAYGIPDMIMTDRGVQFLSREFQAILEELSVKHSVSHLYKPVDNRFIETFWKYMHTVSSVPYKSDW